MAKTTALFGTKLAANMGQRRVLSPDADRQPAPAPARRKIISKGENHMDINFGIWSLIPPFSQSRLPF